MLKDTREKMYRYAGELPPSSARSQAFSIGNLSLSYNETIAHALLNDHSAKKEAERAAALMVKAGAAVEMGMDGDCLGTFVFEDGSVLT